MKPTGDHFWLEMRQWVYFIETGKRGPELMKLFERNLSAWSAACNIQRVARNTHIQIAHTVCIYMYFDSLSMMIEIWTEYVCYHPKFLVHQQKINLDVQNF